jgi:DNA-directed RNA polymerase specialized sigma24 family protein
VLHYFLDLSVSSISEALGISDSAVKNALHKGREALRGTLDHNETSGRTR